ncbi:DegT/DnrJ/EryC1/StrS aminotransferase family protein [Methanogenium sp. MK-MG]|uniref:DegT/DnrJ/EryC1/StrS family aminotransferase n=1 Tax=Methanogenium sp. MK-MG TaxID=2599926 RepID=UPI0013E9B4C6|nr:DegT/DnrJ/EryC1/StrS family aminotransferase [Methanogenium sp. MK-MG]KAF1078998.1 UDP-4-amino-4-deoxy-L-arabinose--oxoglutarate aminotransferase [Methanogenium sp. MK-MG]
MIPVGRPLVGDEEIAAVTEVIRSGMLAQGAVVTAFEDEFAAYCGVQEAVGTNSGTAALHAVLLALGIKAGDEVIVPSFTFIATATAVSMCGATPVMVDVEMDTYTINPEEIAEHITPRTKAVIGVHLFGQSFDILPVAAICDEHDLFLVEDCAQAHGAQYNGEKVGGFGAAGCFSFYPTKNMTTGEGGMVTTNDPELAARVRRVINHGQSDKYLHTELGFNLRMSNLNAAIGRVQLAKLDGFNAQRQANAAYFNENLKCAGLSTPYCRDGSVHVYHQYVVEVGDDFVMDREAFMAYLREKEIGSAVHYPMPVHMQPLYRDSGNVVCPVSDALSSRVLSLPVHPGVRLSDCEYICNIINEVE